MSASQDKIFLGGEGDSWYTRNQSHLTPTTEDRIFSLCREYQLKPVRVLEVGAANGYRLELFRRHFGSQCFGIEPSQSAVAAGRTAFPEISLEVGEARDLSRFDSGRFDMVICSFVLHWIDRQSLLRVVGEIDRVTASAGILAIADFDPIALEKTRYHHRSDVEVYTYKQAYDQLFVASGLYSTVARKVFTHAHPGWSIPDQPTAGAVSDRAAVSLLQKQLTNLYTLTEIKR